MSYKNEKKEKKTKKWHAYALLFLLFIVVGGVGSYIMYYTYGIKKATIKEGVLYVPTATTFSEQAALLQNNGFIKDSSDYVVFAKKLGYDRVKAGRYEIEDGWSLKQLYRVLGGGLQSPVMVSFNNIRNFDKLAGVVSKKIEADSASLMAAFLADSIHTKYGFDSQNFMSMFIPNSYEFYWNTSAQGFVERMNREYNSFWSKNDREKKAKELNMTPQEVSVLASIVIEESKAAVEFKRIAGVYINRLKRNMLLQADPTVKFAMGDMTIKRVLFKHLEYDSPYNTYKYAGLPPGVLCMPPISAIDAVLNYENHDYLYFCASDKLDGTHLFARTLSEHNRNAARYSAALNRLKIY
ncbi:MAG: endolytic transglycosylase MltG [Rikenellaceae bacterium]